MRPAGFQVILDAMDGVHPPPEIEKKKLKNEKKGIYFFARNIP